MTQPIQTKIIYIETLIYYMHNIKAVLDPFQSVYNIIVKDPCIVFHILIFFIPYSDMQNNQIPS